MKKLLMTLMAAMLPLLAFAGDWIEIQTQNNQSYFIYSAIENEYGDHLAWIEITYNTPEAQKAAMVDWNMKKYVHEVKQLIAFNESWTKMSVKSTIIYGKDGSVLKSYNNYTGFDYIVPGSMGEVWRNYARELYNTSNAKSSEEWSDF